jgi:hypothetical protein
VIPQIFTNTQATLPRSHRDANGGSTNAPGATDRRDRDGSRSPKPTLHGGSGGSAGPVTPNKSDKGAGSIEDRCEQSGCDRSDEDPEHSASDTVVQLKGEQRRDKGHASQSRQAEGQRPPCTAPSFASHSIRIPTCPIAPGLRRSRSRRQDATEVALEAWGVVTPPNTQVRSTLPSVASPYEGEGGP